MHAQVSTGRSCAFGDPMSTSLFFVWFHSCFKDRVPDWTGICQVDGWSACSQISLPASGITRLCCAARLSLTWVHGIKCRSLCFTGRSHHLLFYVRSPLYQFHRELHWPIFVPDWCNHDLGCTKTKSGILKQVSLLSRPLQDICLERMFLPRTKSNSIA